MAMAASAASRLQKRLLRRLQVTMQLLASMAFEF